MPPGAEPAPPTASHEPPAQNTPLAAYPELSLTVSASDALRHTPLTRVQVEVDGVKAAAQGEGQFQVQVPPANLHTVRIFTSRHLAQQWSGPIPSDLRLEATLCPRGIRVVGFGDSVTAGLKVDTGSRFVMKLVGPLMAARPGFWVDFVDRGRSGDTYQSALPRLSKEVLESNPDVTLVEFGTNDAARTKLEDFPASIDAILAPISRQCPVVIVTDIPHKGRWYGTWNQQAAPYNSAIAAGAARHGAIYLPLSERFRSGSASNWDLFYHEAPYNEALPDSEWQGDIHPNAAGNDLIAQAIARAILDATAPGVKVSGR